MKLVENYEGKGHCLFTDNYYTSPQLLIDLLEKNVYCAGTIRPTRKNFPRDIVTSGGGDIGTFRFATTNKLTAVCGEIAGMLMLSATCTTHHQHL